MKFKIENLEDLKDGREVLESKPHPFTSIFIYILLVLIGAFLIWAFFSEKEIIVKASGIVKPNAEVYKVCNLMPGKIEEVSFKNGVKVSKGDILYKIDTKELENQKKAIEDNRQSLEDDIANLNKLKKSIDENNNYFNKDDEKEKSYYYKYESYLTGNKTPLSDEKDLNSSKNDLSKKLESFNMLQKSINDGKNYMGKNTIYSEEYNNFEASKKAINEKLDELKKAKDALNNPNKQEIEALDAQIKGVNSSSDKLKSDFLLKVQASKEEIKEKVKAIDNNINKVNETKDLTKEKNKTASIAQIEDSIKADNGKIKEIDSNLKIINANIDKCTVKASEDGILDIQNNLEPGMVVPSGTNILNIMPDVSKYKVDLVIFDKDIGNIKNGQVVKYSFTSLPYREYGFLDGKIENLSANSKVNSEKGIAFYTGEGSLNKNVLYSHKHEQSKIKSGMTCEAKIVTRKEKMLYYLLEKLNLKS